MNASKTAAWVRLSAALGAGNVHADDVLMHFSDAAEFIDAGDDGFKKVGTLTDREIAKIRSFSNDKAEYICEQAEKQGCVILTPDMDEFPLRLKNIPACPLALYVRGDKELIAGIDALATISVVGTRDCSRYGEELAYRLSYDVASAGGIIVSGMALGIDTAAHKGALSAGKKTVAVLGCGVDVCYPKQNMELMEEIASNGALVSEYPFSEKPVGRNFPIRNRIISGLSLGVLAVEAKPGSGALITVRHAAEQGKDIFTVPMSIYEKNAAASLLLIRDGAIAVGCARHILEEYYADYFDSIDLKSLSDPFLYKIGAEKYKKDSEKTGYLKTVENKAVNIRKPIEKTDDATTAVYNKLSYTPVHINDIAAGTGLSVTKVLSALTTLEMIGTAEAKPGRRYVLKN